jgi:hypothetical protein
MPLTPRGKKIMKSMKERYGKKKGEQVFYATKNKGKLKGVEKAYLGKAIKQPSETKKEFSMRHTYHTPFMKKPKGYRGGGMDMGSPASQKKSAAMASSSGNVSRGPDRGNGGVNIPTAPKPLFLPQGGGRNPMAQFTTLPPGYKTSPEASKALTKQRKTTRAQISPSTTFRVRAGATIAGALANTMLPGSGLFVGQKILKDADKHGYWERDKIQKAKAKRDAEDQARRREDTPLAPVSATKPIDSSLISPKDNFFTFVAYSVGGLSGGVKYGIPPKKGPNSQVPPVKMKKGGYKK